MKTATFFLLVSVLPVSAESCTASWYGGAHERRTASGERLNSRALTAAHKKHPFGTRLIVTNLRTGATVEVRVNDRGPFIRGRCVDLTRQGAQALGFSGLAEVLVEVVGGK